MTLEQATIQELLKQLMIRLQEFGWDYSKWCTQAIDGRIYKVKIISG